MHRMGLLSTPLAVAVVAAVVVATKRFPERRETLPSLRPRQAGLQVLAVQTRRAERSWMRHRWGKSLSPDFRGGAGSRKKYNAYKQSPVTSIYKNRSAEHALSRIARSEEKT